MSQSTSRDGAKQTAEHAQRAEALIARMKAARGYIYPEWEFAARQDPEFVETYNRIYELGLGEGRHVSAKVREFVAIALLGVPRRREGRAGGAHATGDPAGGDARGAVRGPRDLHGAGGAPRFIAA